MLLQFGWYTVWILRNWKISSIYRAMRSISPNIINQSINTKWNHKPRRNQVVLYFNLCIQPPYVWYSFPSITPVNCDKLSKAMDCYGYCQWSIWIPLAYNIVPFTYVLVLGLFMGDLPKYYLIHICSGEIKGNTTNIDTILLQFWW